MEEESAAHLYVCALSTELRDSLSTGCALVADPDRTPCPHRPTRGFESVRAIGLIVLDGAAAPGNGDGLPRQRKAVNPSSPTPSRRPHVLTSVRGCICNGEAGGSRQLYELSMMAQVSNGSRAGEESGSAADPRPARRPGDGRGHLSRRMVEQESAPHGRPGRARPHPAMEALTSAGQEPCRAGWTPGGAPRLSLPSPARFECGGEKRAAPTDSDSSVARPCLGLRPGGPHRDDQAGQHLSPSVSLALSTPCCFSSELRSSPWQQAGLLTLVRTLNRPHGTNASKCCCRWVVMTCSIVAMHALIGILVPRLSERC